MSSNDQDFMKTMRNVQILVIIFINIFYALVILLNPGVVSEEDLEVSNDEEYRYCSRCSRKTNEDMKHCL